MIRIKEIKYSLFDDPVRDLKFTDEQRQYYQSDRWRQKRTERIKMDGYKCILCGTTKNLQVHHKYNIDYDEVWQLRTLCKQCHELVHESDKAREILEKIVSDNESLKRENERRAKREHYKSFACKDISCGGTYNLCKTEDIRTVFGRDAPITLIREVFTEIRWLECIKYFMSGYSHNDIKKATSFSTSIITRAYEHYVGLKTYPIYESEDFYMKKLDLTNVKEASDGQRLPAGAYVCRITEAVDVPDKEYLMISYDIAKGEFAGHYAELREAHPDWKVATYYRSYKPRALPMFKRMCSAVSKSNGKYVFDGGKVNSDEKTLAGKLIGIVLQEEEYYGNDGNKKMRLVVAREFPIDKLAEQKVPAPKLLKEEQTTDSAFMPENAPVSEEDIPW